MRWGLARANSLLHVLKRNSAFRRLANEGWPFGSGTKMIGNGQKKFVGPDGKPIKASTKFLAAGKGLPMRSKIDVNASPPRIDLSGPKKVMTYGIFQLDGDELTICLGKTQSLPEYEKALGSKSDEMSRPTEFSPEAGTVIVLRH